MSLIKEIENLSYQVNQTKWKFETEITNKSVPLEQRWKLWCNAPSFLKNTESFIQHMDFAGEEISWDCEWRCSTVLLEDRVECYQGDLDYAIEEGSESELNYKQVDIEKFKEDILARNLVSFQWDW